jgi:hypothetical protein
MIEEKVKNKIYVQSSGFSNQHDYDWKYYDGDISSTPPYQNILGLKQAELNSFCLVLSRSSNGLFLLVSGLPSGRKDIRHRDIRNTVMWSIDQPDDNDEAIFRNLAALAIGDHCGGSILTDRINKAIKACKQNGYAVDFKLLKPESLTEGEKQLSPEKLKPEKLLYSPHNIKNLAEEIKKSSLPTEEKNLIVVTDNKTQVIVEERRLYLSLGDVILENTISKPLKNERDLPSKLSLELSDFLYSITTKLSPKLVLFVIGIITSGGIFLGQNLVTSRQAMPTINLEKIETATVFTGTLNSQTIDKIKLVNSDKKEMAAGDIDSNNNWKIVYKLGSKINCQNQLSIQGFDKGGKEVGESITIHSLCNDSQW